MIELKRARKDLYVVMGSGKHDAILEASRAMDKHVLRLMRRQQMERKMENT